MLRLSRTLAFLISFTLLLSPPSASAQGKKGAMEEFDEVDPYTEGEQELLDRLGYVHLGGFLWSPGRRTPDIEEMVGGTPFLWVETAHFKIGSSLGTYKVPADSEEKAMIKAELGRLKKRFGRVKFPRNRLDPWLRLHLYAQRAEELYAMFMEDFGLDAGDFGEKNPYLGMPKKFKILLCQRNSELARYTDTVYGNTLDRVYRTGRAGDCMFFGAGMDGLMESWTAPEDQPFEAILTCQMAASLATNFVDGFQGKLYRSPRWLGNVLGHVYVRRIDPRWVTAYGYTAQDVRKEDSWKWKPSVSKLVKNEFFVSAKDMFAWEKYEDLNKRDHMIAWSKLDYLLGEREGDSTAFLEGMVTKLSGKSGKEELIERQTEALRAGYGITPEQFDEDWAAYVKKRYKKR